MKCATLNKLIIKLSGVHYDLSFSKAFMTTYQSFTTPEVVLKKLVQRFNVPEDKVGDVNRVVKLRTFNALKQWLDMSDYRLLSPELLSSVEEFVNTSWEGAFSCPLNSLVERIRSQRLRELEKSEIVRPSIDPNLPLSPAKAFFVYGEEEMAQQLTLVDFLLYEKIENVELLEFSASHRLLKNVKAFVERAQSLALWVASVLLWQETLKDRIAALTKVVNIAMHLRKLNNFHAVQALLTGLTMGPVYRLEHTKAGLSRQSQQQLKELQDLMDPTTNFTSYRIALRASNPPAIPFLSPYLVDLRTTGEQEDYIAGLINFHKRELIHEVMCDIEAYQQIGYGYQFNEQIACLFAELPVCMDGLFALSLAREPRGAKADQLA